jgi:hypothetical protein
MKNAGKTISQIISNALVGKTILKIDEDVYLLGRRICKAEIIFNEFNEALLAAGVVITVAAKCGKPEEKQFLPFDKDNKLVLRS